MQSLILEQQPLAIGAYSTRILRRDYQRALMRVRRGSDSAEADVRADSNGVISTDSRIKVVSGTSVATNLGEFVANPSYTDVDSLGSSTSAAVSIWYDQSSSNNHMTQVVTNYQPRIVSPIGSVYQGDNGPQVLFFPFAPNQKFMDLRDLVGDFTVYLSFRLLGETTYIKLYDGSNDLIKISRASNDITLSQITNSAAHLNGYNKVDSTSIGFNSKSDTTLTVSGTFASTGSVKIGEGAGGLSDFYIYPRAKKGKNRRKVEAVTTREKEAPLSYSNRGDIDTTAFLNRFEGAANAFSLRSLNKEDSNPLITVRREIDHKEVFVFPDASGFVSLESLVSESTTRTTGIPAGDYPQPTPPPTRATTLGQFMGDASSSDPDSLGSPTTGRVVTMFDQVSANETLRRRLLDYHTGAEAAYSTKRLSTSYTGPCLEVSLFSSASPHNLISSSDIDFDSDGSISQTFSAFRSQALQTHGASTIVRVSKIYDQSGNGRHLAQSSRDEMPEIFLNSFNGEVGFSFDASNGYRQSMSVSSLSIPTPFSYSTSFYRGLGTIDGYKYIDFGGNVSIQSGASAELSVSDGSNSIEPSGLMPQNVMNHVYGVHDGASSEFGYNGSVTSGSGLTNSITSIQIGESGQGSNVDIMYLHELIVWGENKSTYQSQKEDIDSYSDLVYRTEDSNAKAHPSTAQPKIYDATNGIVLDGGSVSLEVVQDNYFLFDKSKISGKSNVSSFASLSTNDTRGYLYAINGAYHGPRINSFISNSYVSNFGTPSSFIDGEEVTTSNTVQAYNLISDSTKKILSTVGADSSSWETGTTDSEVTLFNYYQDAGSNDSFAGKFQEFIFFNSDVSNDRAAIEDDMNTAFNSYSSARSLGRQKLLNEHPGSAAAYSVRHLNANYSGPIMRIDNGYTELDIYPLINGDLDTESIIQHAKINTITEKAGVSVWYDQSGNGNDAVQATNGNQPLICDNGVVFYENGKPAVKFDGSNDFLGYDAAFTNYDDISVFGIIQNSSSVGNDQRIVAWGSSTMNYPIYSPIQSKSTNSPEGTGAFLRQSGIQVSPGQSASNGYGLICFEADSTGIKLFKNGSSTYSKTFSWDTYTVNQFSIGALRRIAVGSHYEGAIQEVIIYASNKSANRTDIEFNINKYFDISPQGPTKLLLDKYPGSSAAYSLRKLSAKYSGPAIKIRRASDSLEADVFFDGSGNISLESIVANVSETTTGKPQGNATFSLPVSTLGEFVGNIKYSSSGVTDAFLVVWYDQSYNGNDAQQLNAASQPKVVNAGFIVVEGKNPAVEFDGSNDGLNTASFTTISQPLSYISVNKQDTTQLKFLYGSATNVLARSYTSNATWKVNSGTELAAASVNTAQNLVINIHNGSSSAQFFNGASSASGDSGTAGTDGVYIGISQASTLPFDGVIQELILYPSDQSDNRKGIESDINNHYSVFAPELELGLINEFDGAAAAYSLRLLNYFYQGPLVRVRRDSDHVEVDVYPDENGVFSERSLVRNAVESSTGVTVVSPNDTKAFRFGEFAYGANCFVVEWKDQSSNNNHATQDASANQPKIYDSATGVVTENGKPAVHFDGSSKSLHDTTASITHTNSTMLVVCSVDDVTHGPYDPTVFRIGDGSTRANDIRFMYGTSNRSNVIFRREQSDSITSLTYTNSNMLSQNLTFNVVSSSNLESFMNGSSQGTQANTPTSMTSSSVDIGAPSSGTWGVFIHAKIQEAIFYTVDQDSAGNRTDIETNINNFYNIY